MGAKRLLVSTWSSVRVASPIASAAVLPLPFRLEGEEREAAEEDGVILDRLEDRLLLDDEGVKPLPVPTRLLRLAALEEGVDGAAPPSEPRAARRRDADGLAARDALVVAVEVEAVLALEVVRVLLVALLGVLLGVVAVLAVDSVESRLPRADGVSEPIVSMCSGHSK